VANVGFHLAGYRQNPKRQEDTANGARCQLGSFKPGQCSLAFSRLHYRPQRAQNIRIKLTRRIGRNEFLAYGRWDRKAGYEPVLAGVEDVVLLLCGGTGWAVGSRPADGLLFLDHRHFRSRPGGLRSQARRGSQVPSDKHQRRAAPGIWPPRRRHD
jgi:hypothetical protein